VQHDYSYRDHEILLNVADVARWLGVSLDWIRDHATRRYPRLKAIRIGRLLRFRTHDVENFIRQLTN